MSYDFFVPDSHLSRWGFKSIEEFVDMMDFPEPKFACYTR